MAVAATAKSIVAPANWMNGIANNNAMTMRDQAG